MPDPLTDQGFTLAALRKSLGITQVELAAKMGTSQSYVSRLERQTDLHVSTLQRYVRALGGTLTFEVTWDA